MIRGDIKEQKLDRKSIAKREKFKIKSKIILIYDSNYNLMIHEERLAIKHNLTQANDLNDPIDRRIKGFSFHNFKDDRQHSRGEFSLLF